MASASLPNVLATLSLLFVLSASLLASAEPSSPSRRCNSDANEFDYIIVGGGTSGLTLATRLSRLLPSQCILVLEAGPDARADTRVTIPGLRGSAIGSNLDWNYTSIPQPGLGGRSVPQTRGRALGGSSAINLMIWDRATRSEFDAWERAGNPGWNWENMYAAMLRVENFQRQPPGPVTYGEEGVGEGGPIQTSLNIAAPPQQISALETMERLGLVNNLESLRGNSIGVAFQPGMVRLSNKTRSYAVDYLPRANPSNLVVRTNSPIARVELTDAQGRPCASGVRLQSGNALLRARQEVILSAGTFASAQLLELSGIGSSSILSPLGIRTRVSLPGVGENLMDHVRIQNQYILRPAFSSPDVLRFNATRAAIERALYDAGLPSLLDLAGSSYAFLNWRQALGPAAADRLISIAQRALERATHPADRARLRFLTDQTVPQLELIFGDGFTGTGPYPAPGLPGFGEQFFTVIAILQHPLSRGNSHAASADPSAKPRVDPRYLGTEYDRLAARLIAQYARKVAMTAPTARFLQREFAPGDAVDTDSEWDTFVRNTTTTLFHPVGTCAMLPKKDGGVVDDQLKVHGVQRLRVVDASVFPVLVSAHIQTAVYGLAERAAKIIAKAHGGDSD